MIVLLSPSKTQNFELTSNLPQVTKPVFTQEIHQLVQNLRNIDPVGLQNLMSISENLANLNFQRYQSFQAEFTHQNSKPALFAFEGDVYTDIEVLNYNSSELEYANKTIRILSGLYGILRPFDQIQPYRLEMKTKLKVDNAKNLYQFWNTKITDFLNTEKPDFIINLASDEYFKVLQPKLLTAPVINITFKEFKKDTYKIVPIYAKKARGTMANFIVKNKLTNPDQIKEFALDKYIFNAPLSSPHELVFTRKS